MKKYINRMQSVVTILCCALIIMAVQGCSDDREIEEKEKVEGFEKVELLQGNWFLRGGVLGRPGNNAKDITLIKIDKKERYAWGLILSIKEEVFDCSISSRCGNGCFPSSEGKIGKVNEQQIKIFVKQFDQSGDIPECEEIHLKLNKDLGIYNIEKVSEKEIKLVKVE